MMGLIITALRIMQSNGLILPAHLTDEALINEATEYAESYKCDAATAIRDVIDAYEEGAAESADAMRGNDWDYGQE